MMDQAPMTRPITMAVLAIGGQGGGVLVDWIVALAERQGWVAQATSVPGVAQRTGATVYYVEMIAPSPGRTPVLSMIAAPGDVDIVMAAEWMEAGRAIQRGLVTPDRTVLIASTHRTFAVAEKEVPGDGRADGTIVTAAAKAAARQFIGFDMAACADQAGSVVSSVLFGALCASSALPFPREAFEAVITEAGVGVKPSLAGFALGMQPPPAATPIASAPTQDPIPPAYAELRARAAAMPAPEMLAEGLRHVVAYQDIAYGAQYLDIVASLPATLCAPAAKYIARAMAYDDVIRVAALKTAPARPDRIRTEMRGELIAVTEFMHPRMEEILGLLPPFLGTRLERRPGLIAALDRVFGRPRRVRTDTIPGFVLLYLVAGLRGWRRRTLRHQREWARIDAWLAAVRAAGDTPLAAELLTNQRLIKGYSETHLRGLDKYARVMEAAQRLTQRPDAADWVRRLREAALKDEDGIALDQALRTIDSFAEERTAA
jgi:indolepyruvate ferredoxin oxidoreductase beta subunit